MKKVLFLFCLMFVFFCSSAFALSDMQNVQLIGSTLYWDKFENAVFYLLHFEENDFSILIDTSSISNNNCKKDLYDIVSNETYGFTKDTTYNVQISAYDRENNVSLSNVSTVSYTYLDNKGNLQTPSNLTLEFKTFKWDSVPNAENYSISIWQSVEQNGELILSNIITKNNYLDCSAYDEIKVGESYCFKVTAIANGYTSSDSGFSDWFDVLLSDVPLDAPTNYSFRNNVLSWDAVTNATSYILNAWEDNASTQVIKNELYNSNSIDFSSDSRIRTGHQYVFMVSASASGYVSSSASQSDWYYVTDVTEPTIEGDILKWPQVETTNRFKIILNGREYFITNDYSVNLKDLCQKVFGFESGSFVVKFFELDTTTTNITEASAISDAWSGTYNYTASGAKLDVPTNLKWDGKIARWDAVSRATSYDIYLYIIPKTSTGGEYSSDAPISISTNYYDFSSDSRIVVGSNKFGFTVKAKSETYPFSDMSAMSQFFDGENVELDEIQNIHVSSGDGTLSWNAFEGASDYLVDIEGDTFYTNNSTSINLWDHIVKAGEVHFSITAVKGTSGNYEPISQEAEGTLNVDILPGDIDGNKKIEILDVRLLLQEYINSNNTVLTGIKRIVQDIDGNGKLEILDVRLLLQQYINK